MKVSNQSASNLVLNCKPINQDKIVNSEPDTTRKIAKDSVKLTSFKKGIPTKAEELTKSDKLRVRTLGGGILGGFAGSTAAIISLFSVGSLAKAESTFISSLNYTFKGSTMLTSALIGATTANVTDSKSVGATIGAIAGAAGAAITQKSFAPSLMAVGALTGAAAGFTGVAVTP